MIKVLVFGCSSTCGGIENFLKNTIDYIDCDNFRLDFVSFSNKPLFYEDAFTSKNSKIIKITSRKKSIFKYYKELKTFLKESDYDYIHFNIMSYEAFERIVMAYKYTNSRIIIHSHNAGYSNNVKFHTTLMHKLGMRIIKKKDMIKLACGKEAGKWLFDDEEFIVLNNGLNYKKYMFNAENREKIRKKYGIKEDEMIIGHTGRLEKQKNQTFLIDIFYEYYKKHDNAKLMLVGDGSLKENLIQKVKQQNIDDRVIFVGFTNSVNEFYSAFDVFVFPSLYEGLSISLVEAQFNGLKCYSSDSSDLESNITTNVQFISLNKPALEWVNCIERDLNRDMNVKDKINGEWFIENSIRKLERVYTGEIV